MFSASDGSASSDLLADPANFLHSIDIDKDEAILFRTRRRALRQASFVDGRSAIALAPPQAVKLSTLLESGIRRPPVERYILHMAYSGSTLLSRLVDVPGKSLVLKEPRSLTDLATWKTLKLRAGQPTDDLPEVMRFCRDALHRPFAAGENVVIKASNWVNSLLKEPVAGYAGVLSLFVTTDRATFLRAIFRGGPARMRDMATFAWHMASNMVEDGDELLSDAVAATSDELRVANLAMIAHRLQLDAFEMALGRDGWAAAHVLDFKTIAYSPYEAALKASRALGLGLEREEIERAVEQHASRNSKEPELPFSLSHLDEVDRLIVNRHGRTFDAALAWAEAFLGPEADLTPLERAAA